ncbi:MAG: hypothetical protein JO182_31595 [Acidobacteriaceae bacterium]|nr:hypothetical protein [Acidobacteriaceae bacterium]MBV9937383.1 hypothetical protein [Acidobacteriaceae bacterium]
MVETEMVMVPAVIDWSRLLKAAEDTGFQVFVTADQGILYQQNMQGRSIALVVLSTNERSILVGTQRKSWQPLMLRRQEVLPLSRSALSSTVI